SSAPCACPPCCASSTRPHSARWAPTSRSGSASVWPACSATSRATGPTGACSPSVRPPRSPGPCSARVSPAGCPNPSWSGRSRRSCWWPPRRWWWKRSRSLFAMADLQQETTELLQRLLRFNTVNPPGQEREAQEYLRGYLEEAGFECELLALDEARPNLIARLRGEAEGPTLGYLSHVDTVLATPEEWSHDPWSGDLADGFVWGRGALDMKSQTEIGRASC